MSEHTCSGCLYLSQGSNYNYCSMRNRMVEDLNAPICDKWKHKPKKKEKTETEWEWVQIGMQIDEQRSFKR